MNKILKLLIKPVFLIIFSLFAISIGAQPSCIKVDQIGKWEVLDTTKTIIYDSQGNTIAFIIFQEYPAPTLKRSGETFRFFSPTICLFDRVQISAGMTTIRGIEPIRK